jgi:hypothetical protein
VYKASCLQKSKWRGLFTEYTDVLDRGNWKNKATILISVTYSVAYPNLSAKGVMPIKLKRKTHACCEAFGRGETGKKKMGGDNLSVPQLHSINHAANSTLRKITSASRWGRPCVLRPDGLTCQEPELRL